MATRHGSGERKGRRPKRFWVGVAMFTSGLVLLGYVGWQMYGTNIVSERAQARITKDLRADWKVAKDKTLSPKYIPEGKGSALIRIPRFGKDYVVPVLEGVSRDVLSRGFGHFVQSADPGQKGNYALAAHRVTHGQPLRGMPDLRPGDRVIVQTFEATYTYVLDTDPNRLIVPFTNVWVLDAMPKNPSGGVEPSQEPGQSLITLTTCSELFHTNKRMIAFGHLIETAPRATG